MRIGELARLAGTTPRTLRYYESRGLLTVERDAHGHRTYTTAALQELRQIRLLQEIGFDLSETKPFLDCLRTGESPGDTCSDSLAAYRRKLDELDALVATLTTARQAIANRLAHAEQLTPALRQAPGTPGPSSPRSPTAPTDPANPASPAPECFLTAAPLVPTTAVLSA